MVKKFFTKAVIAVLLLSMLMALAACGGSSNTTAPGSSSAPGTSSTPDSSSKPDDSSTNAPGTTRPPVVDTFPAQLEGFEAETDLVEFIYVEGGNGTYTADSIWVDPDSIDLDDVDQQVIARNAKIQEILGVEIYSFTNESLGIADLQGEAKEYFDTQSDELDVYCGYQYFDISVATSGNLVNLNTLVNKNGEKLIDITQPYWATNYINSITYNDLLYWVTGDLSLRYTGGLYCTFVNKTLYDRYVKGNYENRSIYQIVNDGDWTMKTMLDMAAFAWQDEDNSGTATDGDYHGIVYEEIDILDGIAFGCKVQFSSRVGNEISITLGSDSKAAELAGYFKEMMASPYANNVGNADSTAMMPIFADGMACFAVNKLYMAAVWLNEMEDFAIIPTPKLNKSQGEYAAGVHDSLTIFGISKYSDCKATAAATLELMSFYGSQMVTPTYIESVLKGSRTIRDPQDARMVEKIRAGFDSDFAAAWSNSISNIVHIYRDPRNCSNWTSAVKVSSIRTWPKALTDLLTELDAAALEPAAA